VDGIAVTSPTNSLPNAIAGVSLALTATSTTPTTVTVGADATALTTKVNAFITAYNNVVTTAHADAGYGTTAASNTVLQGDPAIRTALQTLSRITGATVAGTSGAYTTMGSVGINLGEDGTLSLDSAAFTAAVKADPTNVERLFVTDKSTGSTGVMGTFSSGVDSLVNNFGAAVATEISSYTQRSASMAKDIAAMQARLDAYQTMLQAEFTAMDTVVSTNRALYEQVGGTDKFV
jgi:flagellar hook-associated protein 2